MRIAIPFLLLLFIPCLLKGESFYVTFIKGSVSKSGIALKTGDILEVTDTQLLEFSSLEDLVVIVNPKKGRYVIRAKTIQQSQNRLWVLVKDNLIPCTQKNSLTTRAQDNTLDLKEFLREGRLAILDTISIPLDKSFWEDRENNFFYIRYNFRNERIEKRLKFKEPLKVNDILKLVIDEDLFIVNGTRIQYSETSDMALYFYEKDISQSIKIKDIKIVQLLDKEVWSGIKIMFSAIDEYFNHDYSLIQKEIKSHVQEFYGKIDDASILKLVAMVEKKEENN